MEWRVLATFASSDVASERRQVLMAIRSTSPSRARAPIRAPSLSRRWVALAARAGYASKGVLYALIGALALGAISGQGGAIGGHETATRALGEQPLGGVLLVLIGSGMLALAAWRAVQAILDPERATRRDPRTALLKRVGWIAGGIVHGAIGVAALELALGDRSPGASGREWISRVLSWHPIGPVLVGVAGSAVVFFALAQIYLAWTTDFTRQLRITEMTAAQRRYSTRLGRIGIFARGVVLAIVGSGIVQAALDAQPGKVSDLGSALRELGARPYGTVLLGIIAAGLFAYGLYEIVEARFRRIPSSIGSA